MTDVIAIAGIASTVGFAVYAIVITRVAWKLDVKREVLGAELAGANGRLTAAQRDLRAHKKVIEDLEAEGGPCVVDEDLLTRLPPGSIRDLIDRELRADEDGVRPGSIGGDGLEQFGQGAEWDLVEQPLR